MAEFDRSNFVNFQLDVAGVKQIDRMLAVKADRVRNIFKIIGPDIKKDFIANEKQQFESEGQHGSGGWEGLSATYFAWKGRHFPGKALLVQTGDMEASLTDDSHSDFIYSVSQTSLVLGTKNWKARIHQKKAGPRDLPERPVIELTEAQRKQWPKWMHEAIVSEDMERINL